MLEDVLRIQQCFTIALSVAKTFLFQEIRNSNEIIFGVQSTFAGGPLPIDQDYTNYRT